MRDILLYLPSKVLPGGLSILTLTILTRTFSVSEYGDYAFSMAIVSLLSVCLFNWLTLGVNRYYIGFDNKPDRLLKSSALTLNLLLGFLMVSLAVITALFINEPILSICFIIAWQLGLFEMQQQANILEGKRLYYTVFVVFRPLVLLMASVIVFFLDVTNYAVLLFTILLGLIVSNIFLYLKSWKSQLDFSREKLLFLSKYGVPLSVNFLLMYIVSSSDKFFIQYYFTDYDLGMYSASYDIYSQVVFGIGSVLSLVLFPKALKAFNAFGRSNEFLQVVNDNLVKAIIFMSIVTLCLCFFGYFIADVVIGEEFRRFAKDSYVNIVILTSIYCIYSYAVVTVMQIFEETKKIIAISLVMAISNGILNFLFLKKFGIIFAVYSSLISYTLGLFLGLLSIKNEIKIKLIFSSIKKHFYSRRV